MHVYWYFRGNFQQNIDMFVCTISDFVLLLLFADAPCLIQWRSRKLFFFGRGHWTWGKGREWWANILSTCSWLGGLRELCKPLKWSVGCNLNHKWFWTFYMQYHAILCVLVHCIHHWHSQRGPTPQRLRKNIIRHHQIVFFFSNPNWTKTRFRPGCHHRPGWGSLWCSHTPYSRLVCTGIDRGA